MNEEKSVSSGIDGGRPFRFLWIAFVIGILINGWGRTTCYWGDRGFLSIGGNTPGIIYPLLFIYAVVRYMNRDIHKPVFWKNPLFLFVAFAAISPLWGPLHDFTRVRGYLLPALAAYWLGSYLVSFEKLRLPYLTVLVSSICLMVLRGMTEMVFIPGPVAIMHSTEEHHTIIAMMIIVALPLALALLREGPLRRPFYYALIAVLLVGLFLSSSRIGWIAFAVIALLSLWKFRDWRTRASVIAVPVVLFLALLLLMPHYRDRFFSLGSLGGDRETGTRLQNWSMCARLIGEHPFTGIGFSNREYYRAAREKDSHFQYEHPHNLVLQAAVSTGIPGLCLLALACWSVFISFRAGKGKELPSVRDALFISLCGFMVMNMADNIFNSQKALLLFFLLLAYTTWWNSSCSASSSASTGRRNGAWGGEYLSSH